MFKNYFVTASRNLIKDYLSGLLIGVAYALLIWLWVNDELHVDKFNKNDSRLYQIIKTSPTAGGGVATFPSTPGLLAQSIQKELPEVEYATAVRPGYEADIISLQRE